MATGEHLFKHGQCFTRLYRIWFSMRQRCNYKKHPHYDRYGGRGIKICDDWSEFIPFQKWAYENGYTDELTIDRIDNDGNYCPENCRWATVKQQANNSSWNRILEYRGEKYTMAQLADRHGIKQSTFRERLCRGMSVEDAVETPVHRYAYHTQKERDCE